MLGAGGMDGVPLGEELWAGEESGCMAGGEAKSRGILMARTARMFRYDGFGVDG